MLYLVNKCNVNLLYRHNRTTMASGITDPMERREGNLDMNLAEGFSCRELRSIRHLLNTKEK